MGRRATTAPKQSGKKSKDAAPFYHGARLIPLCAGLIFAGIVYAVFKPEPAKPGNAPRAAEPPAATRAEPTPPLPANTFNPENLFPEPTPDADAFPRPARTILETQIALTRRGFSCGSIDGKTGTQTRAALRAFQLNENLPGTGVLDDGTGERLVLATPPFATYKITPDDLARLQPLSKTWTGKSEQSALEYETVLEFVAEKAHAHPALVRQLNPGTDWNAISAGDELTLPAVERETPKTKAAQINIFIAEHILQAVDETGNILAHFPVSIAKNKEKRPAGRLTVQTVVPNPNYTFDPKLFPESEEAAAGSGKLILQPGPNNPVGVAWIGLDLPGYGIHGTPHPEQVGRTESHGCFRLANRDAELLLELVQIGTPAEVSP